MLSARARSVLERQLQLREQLRVTGRIDHEHIFFHADGTPIRRLYQVHQHWQRTLKRLAIRYRPPYTARHSSVSWDLMLGRNPLYVAQQHGHRVLTMLTVYAAWTHGTGEADVAAIRRAMHASAYAVRQGAEQRPAIGNRSANSPRRWTELKTREKRPSAAAEARRPLADLATDLAVACRRSVEIGGISGAWIGGADGSSERPVCS